MASHAAKTSRLVGLDVARALAVLGMIIVNFRGKVKPDVESFTQAAWIFDRMEGKWAAVFVVLAGVGIGLQANKATTALARAKLRRSLLTRAVILLAIGVLHQHWWTWDILAFYGVYIAASVVFLWAPSSVLWAAITAMTFASGWQWMNLARPDLNFWTFEGALGKLFFWGNHPTVPWFSLLLFGLWLARRDLRDPAVRLRLFIVALVVLCVAEALNLSIREGGLPSLPARDMFRTWPRPTRPGFIISGVAFATVAIISAIELTERRAEAPWVVAMCAAGQLALTLYIMHVPAVLVPQAHGWMPSTLPGVLAYALGVYCAGVAGALWWRRRFARGPLEGLLAAVTSAPPAAPRGLA
ncbi:MAG: DUF418 domain-containing protein [Nannocystaceae bacterium]|nr:heparan-alpha-glucosaminide N-acetyltransferase domain-containing protein [bacterium]